jgi:hypothetical protein
VAEILAAMGVAGRAGAQVVIFRSFARPRPRAPGRCRREGGRGSWGLTSASERSHEGPMDGDSSYRVFGVDGRAEPWVGDLQVPGLQGHWPFYPVLRGEVAMGLTLLRFPQGQPPPRPNRMEGRMQG